MHITEKHYNSLSEKIMDRVQVIVDTIVKEQSDIYSAYIEGALANALTGILAERIALLITNNPSSKDPAFAHYLICEALRPFVGQLESTTELLVRDLTETKPTNKQEKKSGRVTAKVIPFSPKNGSKTFQA